MKQTIRIQVGRIRCPQCGDSLFSCSPASPIAQETEPLWQHDLDEYLNVVGTHGIPEQDRPERCPHCGQHHRLIHRHSHFTRAVYTDSQHVCIWIFRFRCPECRYAHSIIPAFLEPYQQKTLDVQEHLIEAVYSGATLEEVAEQTDALPGGSCSEKTIRRLVRGWEERLRQLESGLWAWLLARSPHLTLPRTGSLWNNLRSCWESVMRHLPTEKPLRFLHGLNRLCFSLSVTAAH